jgi:protein arginine N-methyltransferase 3
MSERSESDEGSFTSSSQSSGSSGGSFGDWDDADADPACQSLLGPHMLESSSAVWAELKACLGFDMPAEAAARGWETYSLVRLVNFLRRCGLGAATRGVSVEDALRQALAPSQLAPDAEVWRDESLLQPALEDDALLMSALSHGEFEEGVEGGGGVAGAAAAHSATPSCAGGGGGGGGGGPLGVEEAASLYAELNRSRELLRLVVSGAYDSSSTLSGQAAGGDPHAGTGSRDNLTYYFDSYASNTGIHRTMLGDKPRTEAYQLAIERAGMKGARVLDLGCGTGILSLFSADSGASAVVALDASSVIQDAAEIIRLNGKGDTVACVLGRAEEAALDCVVTCAEARAMGGGAAGEGGASSSSSSSSSPSSSPPVGSGCTVLCGDLTLPAAGAPKRVFDVIVSEWMGYALLYESMLASVLIARDRYLKPGGKLLPSSASIFLGAVSDSGLWADKVGWWKSVYGYDMTPMARHAWPEPCVEDMDAASLTSAPPHATVACLRMASMTQSDQDILSVPFCLLIERGPRAEVLVGSSGGEKVVVHGLAIWFSVDFGEDRYWPQGSAPPDVQAGRLADAEAGEEDVPDFEALPSSAAGAPAMPAAPSPGGVRLCTSPTSPPTHWHQTLLLLKDPPALLPGEELRGTFSMVRDQKNPREYRFSVDIGGRTQKWHLG